MKQAFRAQDERGFWSALFVLLVVTLGSLALGSHFMMVKDTEGSVNSALVMQLDYSANAGAYYGIEMLKSGGMTADDAASLTIEGIEVDIAISQVFSDAEGAEIIRLDVTAETVKGLSRSLQIDYPIPRRLEDNAITTEGAVSDNIFVYDEDWVQDPSLMVQGTQVPEIDTDQMRTDASYYVDTGGAAWSVPDDTGLNDFIDSGGQLPIIFIQSGDLQINGNITIYGIYVIMDGNVYLNGTPNITNGVIYVHGQDKMIVRGNDQEGVASLVGGIVSRGDIDGKGRQINIQYCRDYMEQFVEYTDQQDAYSQFIAWRYQ